MEAIGDQRHGLIDTAGREWMARKDKRNGKK